MLITERAIHVGIENKVYAAALEGTEHVVAKTNAVKNEEGASQNVIVVVAEAVEVLTNIDILAFF